MTPPTPNRWGDLRDRVLSGLAMVGIGAVAIYAGGGTFSLLVVAICALMLWELASMTQAAGRNISAQIAAASGVILLLSMAPFATPTAYHGPHSPLQWLILALGIVFPVLQIGLTPRKDRAVAAAYALLITLTCFGFISLRIGMGIEVILWLVLVVVASDILGYFAGRILGGPKFWPSVSPKKTWSGTVAGWVGAAAIGYGFWQAGYGGAALIWLSPFVAFAGQLGDIAESAIKRRAGVKDSSNLIPGHGGVMDRFDAFAGAVVVVALLAHLVTLPIGGH